MGIRTWDKIPKAEIKLATECGIPLPTKNSMKYAQSLLAPSGKGGYRSWRSPQELEPKSKASKVSLGASPAKTPDRGVKRKASSTESLATTPTPRTNKRAKETPDKDESTQVKVSELRDTDVLHYTGAKSSADYLTKRCKRADG